MEFVFKVNEQEANNLLLGLQELPAKIANPIIKKLQEQAQQQIQKQQEQ